MSGRHSLDVIFDATVAKSRRLDAELAPLKAIHSGSITFIKPGR